MFNGNYVKIFSYFSIKKVCFGYLIEIPEQGSSYEYHI